MNYDEANFTDDPGSKQVICRRGTKRPERVLDTSKSSTSVMFSATASGQWLHPYIIYKAKNLYSSWLENGIKGAVYSCNISGWFDSSLFEDWFFKIILPYIRRFEGPKVIIGDNLASHISYNVLKVSNMPLFLFLIKIKILTNKFFTDVPGE